MKKGERLKKLIEESPYKNVSQFSKAAGVPYTTVASFIERDLHKAGVDNVFKVAKTLNVSVDYLVSDEVINHINEGKEKVVNYAGDDSTHNKYHYMPTTISAGLPINVDGITDADKISIPDAIMGKWAGHTDILFTRISGDSMNNIMADGSLIAIKPVDNVENLKDGDMVVFSHNHEYSVKYFYKTEDKLIFKPDSTNIAHHEQHFDINDGVQIHGKVVLYIVELD